MSTCYSFFGGSNETMRDHIEAGLDIIKLFEKYNYDKYLTRILEIDPTKPNIAKDVLELTYVFHDIGKGLEKFQTRKKGFLAHEFYSSYIFYKTVSANWLDDNLKTIMSIAIMLHHHTMKNRIDIILNNDDNPLNISECCIDLFAEYGKEYEIQFDIKNAVITNNNTKNFCIDINETLSEKSSIFRLNSGTPMIRKVYAILYPIIIADNYSANVNRGKSGKGILMHDIEPYVELLKSI